ncbi:hypothetical protein [Butyrivibrio hungatei]|uniref:hypothetical protein n=1 Tax=Butyrivibrio hungatei TaxID=185008 RepID=UPI000410C91C|nr:hypothetical protein [Butyrivibrio hungatei]
MKKAESSEEKEITGGDISQAEPIDKKEQKKKIKKVKSVKRKNNVHTDVILVYRSPHGSRIFIKGS